MGGYAQKIAQWDVKQVVRGAQEHVKVHVEIKVHSVVMVVMRVVLLHVEGFALVIVSIVVAVVAMKIVLLPVMMFADQLVVITVVAAVRVRVGIIA